MKTLMYGLLMGFGAAVGLYLFGVTADAVDRLEDWWREHQGAEGW